MPLIVVLAVCMDPSLTETQGSAWKSAGFIVMPADSIREAIDHFRAGDFDLVLLGPTIPAESRERITFLIRAFGSRVPVVCIATSSSHCDSFADATLKNDSNELLEGIAVLLASRARILPVQAPAYG